jgi:hypothetical protein
MLTLIAAVTLAQINTAPPPGFGSAYSAVEHCMLEAAKTVDDYISDANTIVQAIEFGRYCRVEFHAYQRSASQQAGMTDETGEALDRDRQKMELMMVLIERKQRTTQQKRP